jgi:hypothetical protein
MRRRRVDATLVTGKHGKITDNPPHLRLNLPFGTILYFWYQNLPATIVLQFRQIRDL